MGVEEEEEEEVEDEEEEEEEVLEEVEWRGEGMVQLEKEVFKIEKLEGPFSSVTEIYRAPDLEEEEIERQLEKVVLEK